MRAVPRRGGMVRLFAWIVLVAFAMWGAVALVPPYYGPAGMPTVLPYPVLAAAQYGVLFAALALVLVAWAALMLGASRPLGASPEALGVCGIVGSALLAVLLGRVSPLQAGLGAALGIVAWRAGLGAHRALDGGETVGVSSQWGGLGGGLGGWQVSRPAALLMLMLVAGLAAAAIVRPAAVAPPVEKGASEAPHK